MSTEARAEKGANVMHIILVDDDAVDRRRVRRALREADFACHVEEADGVDAMRSACSAREFDCAIIDYRLPGVDGLDLLGEMRKAFPSLPIVMVTGQGDEMVAREALSRGAADYLPKSVLDPSILRRTIERAMENARLKKRLEQRRAELESFARILVHDLNAPISSTCLAASMIKDCMARRDFGSVEQYCDQVMALGESMRTLINDLHAHTRCDMSFVVEPFELESAYSSAVSNLGAAIAERGAEVSCGDLPKVEGGASQITQLLQNLIGNGIKYSAAPTPLVQVEAQRRGSDWRVSVIDNGIGVPAEFRESIFEPFKRLHTSSEYAGAGIGLATCRKIVERHGGAIWCEDNEGGGSIFRFTLPGVSPTA